MYILSHSIIRLKKVSDVKSSEPDQSQSMEHHVQTAMFGSLGTSPSRSSIACHRPFDLIFFNRFFGDIVRFLFCFDFVGCVVLFPSPLPSPPLFLCAKKQLTSEQGVRINYQEPVLVQAHRLAANKPNERTRSSSGELDSVTKILASFPRDLGRSSAENNFSLIPPGGPLTT